MPSKPPPPKTITLPVTEIGQVQFGILGISPYIHSRMSEKAKHELLFPKGRPNQAEKAARLKHEPVEEFRASPYTLKDEDAPTYLATKGDMFKATMRTAAKDLPGVNGEQIGRLVWVEGMYLPLWGNAKLHMAVVRSANQQKTPDIRTRAISEKWATVITVRFVKPLMNEKIVTNLLSTGGQSAGVGDWRTEKGKGTFGQFILINTDELMAHEVMKMDRAVQIQAMEAAQAFDDETQEMLTWFDAEREERGR
jgi:hypothetical protein